MTRRPVNAALSDLSVTEFLTLSRMGFLPRGVVIGVGVNDSGLAMTYTQQTGELAAMSNAMRAARSRAVGRMRAQAAALSAEGVVGVRLRVEHHRWRGGHNVVKFVALGTAIAFDVDHGPDEFRAAPSLRRHGGAPFTSDLSGQDFVALLRAGYRPLELAMGSCVFQIDPSQLGMWNTRNEELPMYTQAFFDAREYAMERLARDVYSACPSSGPDASIGVVGMTVTETMHGEPGMWRTVPVVEFTAVGTAIAPLSPTDPRRAPKPPAPTIVVPLDR